MPEGQENSAPINTVSSIDATPKLENEGSPTNPENARPTTIAERIAVKHPDWPPLKLKFYFAPHNTEEDIAGIKDHMEDSDIVLYENSSGNQGTELFQQIANIDADKYDPHYIDALLLAYTTNGVIPEGHYEGLLRALYGTKKFVGHIDLRPGDPVSREDIIHSMQRPHIDPNFDKTLDNLNQNFNNYSQLQQQREQIMEQRLEEELEKIISEHPELKDKDDLKMLISKGGEHTPLYFDFKDQGIDTERAFSTMPFIYDYESQARRTFAFGKEPSRYLLAKAYLNQIFNGALSLTMTERAKDTDQQTRYIRHVTSQFTTPEIEGIHEMYIKGLQIDAIDKLLQTKGLDPLPRNDEQLQHSVDKQQEAKEKHVAEIKLRHMQRRQQ